MCGITAIFRDPESSRVGFGAVEAMTKIVAHRGPDGDGIEYYDRTADGVRTLGEDPRGQRWHAALGHRRLSILDLSAAGRQPMSYRDRLWLTFNGEIYNYVELRAELSRLGHEFHSDGDTPVILAAYEEWGVECFARFRGMWGMVIVDGPRGIAVLSRDRLGIKPLYVYGQSDAVAVVSEIKQLTRLPGCELEVDEGALRSYVAIGYEESSRTFFRGVKPVPAGTYQVLDLDSRQLFPPKPYWFPERVAVSVSSPDDAARMFRAEFETAVRLHLRSDVPVGCALSGGLDSSSIAACVPLVQPKGGVKPLQTFSATFPGDDIDETPYIDLVARTVGAEQHKVTPTVDALIADLDAFSWHQDEPVGSLSQYAGYAVARLTRSAGVPVTLNGQGGDELLSGYWQCYFAYLQRLARHGRVDVVGRHMVGAVLPGGNPELVRQAPGMLRRYLSRVRSSETSGPAHTLLSTSAAEWRVYELRELTLPRLLKWDDRNFMAFSVEGRYPFLDHVLIELCLSFSQEVLYRRGWTKEPMRRALEDILPADIARRKSKVAFETPQGRWIGGALSGAMRRLVTEDSPIWAHTDRAQARALLDSTGSNGAHRESQQALVRLLLLDRWMRVFGLS